MSIIPQLEKSKNTMQKFNTGKEKLEIIIIMMTNIY